MEGTRVNVRALLLKMLIRENALRLSTKVQSRYAQRADDFDWKTKVTGQVQRQVCHEFGFTHDLDEGIDLLQSPLSLFPDDEEVRNAAHWLKYNIIAMCPIAVGTPVPDVPLTHLAGSPTSLHNLLDNTELPTVIVAGSHT